MNKASIFKYTYSNINKDDSNSTGKATGASFPEIDPGIFNSSQFYGDQDHNENKTGIFNLTTQTNSVNQTKEDMDRALFIYSFIGSLCFLIIFTIIYVCLKDRRIRRRNSETKST